MPETFDQPTISTVTFGETPDGRAVDLVILRAGELELRVINLGGTIVSLRVPDREGALDDVVLGHDSLHGYLHHSPYFGAIVGRYANRVAQGRFVLDGVAYDLAQNSGGQHLHGGVRGFDKLVWKGRAMVGANGADASVAFGLVSPHRDEGYPGTLEARVTYTLTARGERAIDYVASTDRPTVVNLTQHSYFNLAGSRRDSVLDHELTVFADDFVPVNGALIPTGELAPVQGTPLDFRSPALIGERIDDPHEQIRLAGGYDHTYVLRHAERERSLVHAARVAEPLSGRTLDVYTTEPGMQLYSGNCLDGSIRGKDGRIYGRRGGVCLETQHFPDSPNQPAFPSVVLRPGEEYRSRTVYVFGVAG